MGVSAAEFQRIVDGLGEVGRTETRNYTAYSVRGKGFGYYWPRTETVGLKQTLVEQRALVAERPNVFEIQFTTGAFGWVVCYLEGLEADELSELVYEAWRLSAPEDLVATVPPPATAR